MTNEIANLGAVEQTGAHLVLHDATLGEHPDQVEIVDREPGIAPDRRALEAGIRTVDVAPEDDVTVVVGEEELLAVLPRDPPDRRELGRLLVEVRPHGGGEDLGHGSRKGWRGGEEGRPQAGPQVLFRDPVSGEHALSPVGESEQDAVAARNLQQVANVVTPPQDAWRERC